MTGFLSYLLNFIPIPIGILALYVIKSIHISSRKIRVYGSDRKVRRHSDYSGKNVRCLSHSISPNRGTFRSFAREMLIVNGKLSKSSKIENAALIFCRIGLMSARNVNSLSQYLAKTPKKRIHLFLNDDAFLFECIMAFGDVSGILIAYSLDCGLDFVSDV